MRQTPVRGRRRATSRLRGVALAERLERARALDRPIHALTETVVRALPAGPRTDALHGVPFGQPAHPALVRLPLGCWTSAVLLDLFRVPGRATRVLIGMGVLGVVPAAATGLADWSVLHRDQQRVGLVHLGVQSFAAALFTGSALARAAGRDRAGRFLAAAGLGVAYGGAYLGGHLALRLGAGTSHADQIGHLAGTGWHDLCTLDSLPERRPVRRQLGYLSLLAYRSAGSVFVLSDRCAHLGGPLHQGRVKAERGTLCVVCPWHESTFALADGRVVHGPATARQPSFQTRITDDGIVQVLPRALGARQPGDRAVR